MKNSFVVLIVAFGLSLGAYADVYRWIGGDGRWGDKTNWRNDTKELDGENFQTSICINIEVRESGHSGTSVGLSDGKRSVAG